MNKSAFVGEWTLQNHKYSDRKNTHILYHTKYSQAINKVNQQLDFQALQLCHTPGKNSKIDYDLLLLIFIYWLCWTEC